MLEWSSWKGRVRRASAIYRVLRILPRWACTPCKQAGVSPGYFGGNRGSACLGSPGQSEVKSGSDSRDFRFVLLALHHPERTFEHDRWCCGSLLQASGSLAVFVLWPRRSAERPWEGSPCSFPAKRPHQGWALCPPFLHAVLHAVGPCPHRARAPGTSATMATGDPTAFAIGVPGCKSQPCSFWPGLSGQLISTL